MMRGIILSLIVFFIAINSYAQSAPVVKEEATTFGNQTANSLTQEIPEAALEHVKNEFKSMMKVYGGKVKESKGIITAENVVIKTMGSEPQFIMAKIVPLNDGVRMAVAFSVNGNYITSTNNKEQYAAADNLLYNFALRMAKKGVQTKKSGAEKNYTKLLKDQKKLQDRQAALKKNIEKWEKDLKTAKKEIEANEKQIDILAREIENQKKQIDKISDKQKAIGKME